MTPHGLEPPTHRHERARSSTAAQRSCRGPHTPVWFMRQAGRSLPEYRAIRGEGSILDAIKQPEFAAEITMQPVRRYGVDAAVLYSDIVVAPHAVGFGIDVAPGTGPVAEHPLRSSNDVERLRPLEFDDIDYVIATVERLVAELDVPLLAFAGAPFTVASYLIEGRPSKDYRHTKALDPHRRGALARRDGTSRRIGDHVHRCPALARRRSVPAVRLVGRLAEPSRLRPLRAPPLTPRVPRAEPPPPRTRRRSTSASAATTSSNRCTRPARR